MLAAAAAEIHPVSGAGTRFIAAEPLRHVSTVVADTLAVVHVVRPVDVVVAAVDEKVAVGPVAAPAPIVAQAPERVAGTESQSGCNHACADIGGISEIVGWIGGVRPGAVDHRRIIIRNVHGIGIGRFDHDDLLVLDLLNRDLLLLGGRQLVVRLRPRLQALDRIHHVRLLSKHGVAERLGPVELVVHHLEHARRAGQRLDAVVPGLLVDFRFQLIAFEVLVLFDPAGGSHHFQRIGRSRQHVGEQRVRIERDRRNQRIQLLGLQQSIA